MDGAVERLVGGRSGRAAGALWAVVVVAVVGAGVLGRGGGEERAGERGVDRRVAASAAGSPARPAATAPAALVALTAPAAPRTIALSPDLAVVGRAATPVVVVEVSLRARANRVLRSVSLLPAGGSGAFATSFPLPNPRPNGTMWVVAVGYGADGLPLDAVRREVEVGRLVLPEVSPPRTSGPWVGMTRSGPLRRDRGDVRRPSRGVPRPSS